MEYLFGMIHIETDCRIDLLRYEVKCLRRKYGIKIEIKNAIIEDGALTFMLYSEILPKKLDIDLLPLIINIFRDKESGRAKIININ